MFNWFKRDLGINISRSGCIALILAAVNIVIIVWVAILIAGMYYSG